MKKFPVFNFFPLYFLILFSKQNILFCYNRMYRTLTYPKRHRRLPHRRLIFNNIISNLNRSLLDIIFHKNPCIVCFLQSMQGQINVCLIPVPSIRRKYHTIQLNTQILPHHIPEEDMQRNISDHHIPVSLACKPIGVPLLIRRILSHHC